MSDTSSHIIPLIYIIILSWNHKDDLLRCLHSLKELTYPNYKVVIVDNASQDDSVRMVKKLFPEHQIIVNEKNLGFSKGCNIGLRYAIAQQADYVLTLNQDTVVSPTMLEGFLNLAQTNPTIALLNPKTYFMKPLEDGRYRLYYAGAWEGFLPLEQRLPGMNEPDRGLYDIPSLVGYAWGHALLARRDVLEQVGLFDETFFMYYEDLDLCRRMKQAGYQVWYAPQAEVWHNVPDGDRRTNFEVWRWVYKITSMRIFYKKHYGYLRGEFLSLANIIYMSLRFFRNGYRLASLRLYTIWLTTLFRPLINP